MVADDIKRKALLTAAQEGKVGNEARIDFLGRMLAQANDDRANLAAALAVAHFRLDAMTKERDALLEKSRADEKVAPPSTND